MTLDRVARPGPRTAAPRRSAPERRSRQRTPGRLVAPIAAVVVLVVAACGAAGPSPSARTSVTPAASAATGSAAPGATQPNWPGTTVVATIALGAADGEIQKAGADLAAAAEKEDLRAMWGAADGLATLIDELTPDIERMESYPVTQPAGAIYRKAFPELAAGAKQLRDAITAGDAKGVVAGTRLIQQGLKDYAPVRPLIGGLVDQAIVQQRLLVR